MRFTLAALLMATTLSACAVYTPSGSVVIDPARAGTPAGNGKFCPPGQAKKGNC
mgnify:CR=1 FL=1